MTKFSCGKKDISQLSFKDANHQHSEFIYTNLARTSFKEADLRGSSFLDGIQWHSEAGMPSTDFTDADLRYSYFRDEVSDITLTGAAISGALFTWVTGSEIQQMPKHYFNDAICMNPNAAKECHSWHLDKFRGIKRETNKPTNCPTEIVGPIILVYGHEPERQECQAWVDSPK